MAGYWSVKMMEAPRSIVEKQRTNRCLFLNKRVKV